MYPAKNTCSDSTIETLQKGFNNVVLVFLLLTLDKFWTNFINFSSVSNVYFKQVNLCWVIYQKFCKISLTAFVPFSVKLQVSLDLLQKEKKTSAGAIFKTVLWHHVNKHEFSF